MLRIKWKNWDERWGVKWDTPSSEVPTLIFTFQLSLLSSHQSWSILWHLTSHRPHVNSSPPNPTAYLLPCTSHLYLLTFLYRTSHLSSFTSHHSPLISCPSYLTSQVREGGSCDPVTLISFIWPFCLWPPIASYLTSHLPPLTSNLLFLTSHLELLITPPLIIPRTFHHTPHTTHLSTLTKLVTF